ncbi:pyocin activator PrtN family protein [Pseudoalteromonas sp. N1230-9]|uniref:pyocin activator PrtN family protein n=1 Tax=unclassified Pseudoalteromonas TaxID=194690 RepID=UPI0010234184|nr:pyocin activator protein PrtN [Pseudoalteromonas sp. CO302Y]RZG11096.1 pyocin activator protein PrtN [Pseudoalteromonas sp. CO133X]WOC25884.1 pyocin activator PrtN family protein [Pseudoalteromonas sp. N1230-9]
MNMTFALLARYNTPVVRLKDICVEHLGIQPKTAEQKAKAAQLPFPTFKAIDSERSPTLVNVSDLGEYLQTQYEKGRAEWQSVNN